MKSSKSAKSVLLACVASLALSACQNTTDSARQEIASTTMQGQVAKQAFEEQKDEAGPDNVRYRKGPWLGDQAIKSQSGEPLPATWEQNDAIQIDSQTPLSIVDLARYITSQTSIEVAGTTSLPQDTLALVTYKGPLSGILNIAAAKYGISWEYRAGQIRFFETQTRSFTLVASPYAYDISNKIKSTINTGSGSGGSGGGSGSGSNNSASSDQGSEGGVKTTRKLEYWARVKDQMESIVPQGTKWSISPESGSITVTGTPDVLQRVETFVKAQNAKMGRQVALSVKVLSITENESQGLSTDFNAIFADASAGIGASLNTLAPGIATATTSIAGKITKGDFDGTNLLIQALEKKSHVSIVTTATGITMNNVPLPLQVSKENSYIDGYTQNTNQDSTTLTPTTNKVTTGFSMTALPQILSSNKLALRYSVGISNLDDLATVGPTDFQVQTPEVSARGFQQDVMLRSGDTLILGGFEKADNEVGNTKNGILSWLVGGDRSASKDHELIILLITPVIIEDPSDIAQMK